MALAALMSLLLLSRPSRGAWIEIDVKQIARELGMVAPLAGRVD